MADVFGDQPQNDDVNFETLVGDGKKYRDVNDLAKAYVNADTHIEELRRDLAQARAERDAEKNRQPNASEQQPQANQPIVEPVQPQSKEDLRTQLREELKNLTQEQTFENNVETTAQKLIDHYGDSTKANLAVKERARELGVSVDWLRDSAARTPAAFYTLMRIDPSQQAQDRSTPSPKSEMRTNISHNPNVKNFEYYRNLKKENKALYYSVNVQQEMQKQAKDLGDAFYT